MKKNIISLLLIVTLLCTMPIFAFAESYEGTAGLTATYTKEGKITSNFTSDTIASDLSGLQPGDDMTVTVTLKNSGKSSVNWYMLNEIISSLEDENAATGGAYTYQLSYKNSDGKTREIYNSERVGGELIDGDESGKGLHEVDSALKDYFYLETMKKGQSGTITLKVLLDGESQVNSYQNTAAKLRMRFAAESMGGKTIVQTEDSRNLMPFYIVKAEIGAFFLVLALDGLRQRKREGAKA